MEWPRRLVYPPTVHNDRPRVVPERVTDTYAITMWEGLVLWVADGETPLDELRALTEFVLRYKRERGERQNVALTVIHGTRTGMTAEARKEIARLIDLTKHTRRASSTVVLAEGMLGALHRSILTGLSLLVPPPHPVKITGDVASAVAFLHPYIEELCGPIPPQHVAAMVGDLHGAICAEKLRLGAA